MLPLTQYPHRPSGGAEGDGQLLHSSHGNSSSLSQDCPSSSDFDAPLGTSPQNHLIPRAIAGPETTLGVEPTTRRASSQPGLNIEDVYAMIERLNKLFHNEKEAHTKFLGCRGSSAQWLLDVLQDLLDYDLNIGNTSRRRLFKALIRLSTDSKLHPRCFPLTGLEQERLVAGGSYGDVYKGLLCGQTVAVKMMRVFETSDVEALVKEFGREALIWRQLCHPNLLPFFGLYYFQGRLCLVSPWMENGHIRAFLKKEPYDTDSLLSLILDIALGLEDLHDKSVVHGDLKGDNIFIPPSRRACIADFGLSSIKTSMSSMQFTNSSKRSKGGTARYQAPELHRGGHNDSCSDIYAFACLVYELLTGKAPFPELPTDSAVVMAVLEGRRPSRTPACAGTPSLEGLWNLLQSCWEGNPEMRPAAVQLVERLMSPDIQASKTECTIDWDDTFTSRFRRRLMGHRPLPSVPEFEHMISSNGQVAGENSIEPETPVNLRTNVNGFISSFPDPTKFHSQEKSDQQRSRSEVPRVAQQAEVAQGVSHSPVVLPSIHEMFPEHLISAGPPGYVIPSLFPRSHVVPAPPPSIPQPSFSFDVLKSDLRGPSTEHIASNGPPLPRKRRTELPRVHTQSASSSSSRWAHRSRSSHSSASSDGDGEEEVDMEDEGEVGEGKKHVCPTCGKRFNRPSSLRIHVNTHTGATPFRCPHPGCGRAFNVNSNMRRHFRNHAAGAFSPISSLSLPSSSGSVPSPMTSASSSTSPTYSYTP